MFNVTEKGVEKLEPSDIKDDRRKLISNILSYRYSRFYTRIIEAYPHIFDDLIKKTKDELVETYEMIKAYVKSRRSSEQYLNQFKNLLTACDTLCSNFGFEVQGASNIILQDDEVLDTLEEVRLKYESQSSFEPETLLFMTVISVYLKVNAKNKLENQLRSENVRKGIRENLEKPAEKNLQEEFSDI